MPTFAELILEANTTQMAKAEGALKKVTAAGVKTEAATDAVKRSTTQMATAQRGAVGASKALATANRGATMQTANLASQFNDIGVMLAAGQSPLQLALQQGTQINQVFTQMGGGATALKSLGPALMSMINPLSLATIGLIAGGSALVQWGMGAIKAGRDTRTFEDRLDDLSSAVSEYKGFAETAGKSTAELRANFGLAAASAGQIADGLAQIARIEAVRELDSAVNDLTERFGGLSRSAMAFDGVNRPIVEILGTMDALKQELGLTEAQARAVVLSLEGMASAATMQDKITAANDLNAAFIRVFGSVEQVPVALLEAQKEALLLANNAAEIEGAVSATVNPLTKVYQLYASSRTASNESAKTAREMLATLNDEVTLQATIATYGAESAQVAQLRAKAERDAFEETLASMNVSAALKNELRLSWVMAQNIANTNIAANIAAGASEAERLADWLGISLARATALAATTPEMAAEDEAMGIAVIPTREQNVRTAQAVQTLNNLAAAASNASRRVGGGSGGLSTAMREAEQAATAMAEEIERLEFDADPVKKYTAALAELDNLRGGGLSDGAYAHALAEMNEELANSLPMVNDVADAFGEWVANGFKDFKGMVDSIWSSFKGLIAKMIATAARNQIMLSLGMTGTTGVAGGIGQALGGAGGMLGAFGGGSGLAGLAGGTGLMGGLGNALGGGLSNVFAVGGNAALAGGGAMATIGAAIPVIGAVAAAVSFFSSKTKQLDAGLRLTAEGADLTVKEFEKLQKSRFWGLSKSEYSTLNDAEKAIAKPLVKAYGQIFKSVEETAATLNIGGKALEDFAFKARISTKDMSAAEAQAAVMAELQKAQDQLAKRALVSLKGTANLIRNGEAASQALDRLSSSMAAANYVIDRLGGAAFDFTAKGAAAASKLVDVAGGIDALAASADFYMANFLSPEEQIKILRQDFKAAVGELGIGSVPQNREDFSQLVDKLLANGRNKAATGLVGLSDEFMQIKGLKDEIKAVEKATRQGNRDRLDAAKGRFADRAANLNMDRFSSFNEYRAEQVRILTKAQETTHKNQNHIIRALQSILNHTRATDGNTSVLAALTGR